MAVAATAASTGRTSANAGMRSVPSPNPVKKVRAAAASAMMHAMTSSIDELLYCGDAAAMIERLARATRGNTLVTDESADHCLIATLAVTVERTAPSVLTLTERWARVRPSAPSGVGERWGRYRWSARGHLLRLEHLRLGHNRPVALADLVAVGSGDWRSVTPHLCALDSYHARVSVLDNGGVGLDWTVSGPRKALLIRTRYRPARR